MNKLLENRLFRILLSTLLFCGFYALALFLVNGAVVVKDYLISVVTYFFLLCLMSFIAPKLQKLFGFDKDK